MEKKRTIFRSIILVFCLLAICAVLGLHSVIDWGTISEINYDAQTWQTYHPLGGAFTSSPLESLSLEKRDNHGLNINTTGYFFGDTLFLFLPAHTQKDSFTIRFEAQAPLLVEETPLISGLSTISPSQLSTLRCGDSVYHVQLYETVLPTLEITTIDDEVPRFNGGSKGAVMNLYATDGTLLANDVVVTRVRGNTTGANASKIPLRISGSKPLSLLGLAENDAWTLLANQFDPSLLRNQIAFDLANNLGMEYTPEQQYIDLYLNGKYFGVYTLTTDIGINTGSVDLPPISSVQPNDSYLVELDFRASDEVEDYKTDITEPLFTTASGIPVVLDSPSSIPTEIKQIIQQEIGHLDAAICSPDGTAEGVHFTDLIDLSSFASFFLVQELMMNPDAAYPLSVYLYKNSSGLFCMGPVWDFDLTLGLDYHNTAIDELVLQDAWWWTHLLKDPKFLAEVQHQLDILSPWFMQVDDYLVTWEKTLSHAADTNYIVAYAGSTAAHPDTVNHSFSTAIENLSPILSQRYKNVVQQINTLAAAKES